MEHLDGTTPRKDKASGSASITKGSQLLAGRSESPPDGTSDSASTDPRVVRRLAAALSRVIGGSERRPRYGVD